MIHNFPHLQMLNCCLKKSWTPMNTITNLEPDLVGHRKSQGSVSYLSYILECQDFPVGELREMSD